MIKNTVLCLNRMKNNTYEVALQCAQMQQNYGMKTFFLVSDRENIEKRVAAGGAHFSCEYIEEDAISDMDAMLVFGGDGTMLRVLDRYVPYDVPVLGINLGRLGFLPEVETADMDRALQYLLEEKYEIEHRMMLYYHVSNRRESIVGYATNEISVSRGLSQRMIAMDVKADGRFVEHYIADGALVASPTGSTAYSLSAGGPIISPDVDCLLVNPICPHALESRPIILSDHCQVELCLNMKEERKGMQFSADGGEDNEMFIGDRVSIQRSPHDALMIRLPGEKNFFKVLKEKLSQYNL